MAYFGDKKREYQKNWLQSRRREWLIENGPCVKCGSSENLEVDHIFPADKLYHPGELWSRSKAFRESELKKCQVLCEICHIKKSSAESRDRLKGKANLSARTIPAGKYKDVINLIALGFSERKACEQVGMSRGTFSSIKIRGNRTDVFGSRSTYRP